jgi:hypothetical protein
MSTYGVTSTSPLEDLPDDPELLFQQFLQDNWNDLTAGINKVDIDFGYEPDQIQRKKYIVKVEENFTDHKAPDLGDRYDEESIILDVKIWEKKVKVYKNTQMSGSGRYKIRKYIKRLIKQNCRDGITIGGKRFIKHFYLITSRNTPEPERQDWHSAVVTFSMKTWIVSTV